MTRIAGASQYLVSSTLANKRGFSAQSPSLLGNFSGAADLLAAGKRINRSGIGMSATSRQLLNNSLASANSTLNALLSANVSGSVESAQTQILGLRASLPKSMISEHAYRGNNVDKEA